MKYKSDLITTAVGKLNSLVFTRGAGMPRIVSRAQAAQTPTPAQLSAQVITSAFSKEWSALAATAQASWRTTASGIFLTDVLGNSYRLTGHQLFVMCNSNQYFSGQPTSDNAPAAQDTVPALSSLTLAASSTGGASGGPSLIATLGSNPGGYALVIRATRDYSAGVAVPAASAFKLLGHEAAGFSTTQDLTADYLALLPALAAKKRVSVSMFLVSPAGFAGATVTASALIS